MAREHSSAGERAAAADQNGWAVILGASEGTGAAIARAAARELDANIFGIHRGHHQDKADALQRAIEEGGRRAVMRVGDAGTAEGAAVFAEALEAAAGKRSVRLF